jgi:membrane associated rhomboid family serine protease
MDVPMTKNPAVVVLIAVTVAAYLVQGASGDAFELLFALWPLQAASDGHSYFHVWQIVTYAFLHDTHKITHILFNMIGVFMFGAPVERYVGGLKLYACYFAAVVTAALTQLIVPPLMGAPALPTVGASGGVFGLLLAYAVMFPEARVALLILPIPLPARVFAALYAAAELFLGVTGTQSGVAHFAHLGGLVGSALVLAAWRRQGRRPQPGGRTQ